MLNIMYKDLCLKSDCSIRVLNYYGECSITIYIINQTLPKFLATYYAQNYAGIISWFLMQCAAKVAGP